jgi:hypothetical protein
VATTALAIELTETWEHELGSRASGALLGADIYLIRTSPRPHGECVADLRQQVHFAYFAFLLSSGFVSHDPAYLISGVAGEQSASLKEFAVYPAALSPSGAPPGRCTEKSLMLAFKRAEALASVYAAGVQPRFGRVMFAFLQAITYRELDRRLHQFVRCTEGFIHPGKHGLKRRFVDRGQLLLGNGIAQREVLTNLWDLRSVTEHLHGPFEAISATGERARRLALLRRAIEAEILARYSIESFVDQPKLWEHFESPASAEAFWALSGKMQRALWGEKLNLSILAHHFDPNAIPDRDLGLEGENPSV